MKHLLLLCLICSFCLAPSAGLRAQSAAEEGQMIEMTPDELKVLIRKMAQLRQRRYLLAQQRMRMQARRAPSPVNTARTQEQTKVEQQTITVVLRETPDGRVDTTVTREQGIVSGDGVITNLRQTRPATASSKSAARPQAAGPTDVDDLRRRLDRQEAMLAELLDRQPSPTVYPTMPVEAYRPDTVVQRIMSDPAAADRLSRNDLDALTTELRSMNAEIDELRRQLAEKEDQRIQAERRADNRADRIYDREAAERFDREMRERERALARQRDLDRQRRGTTTTPSPGINLGVSTPPATTAPPAEVIVVRDTVYVDRVSTTPVYIPVEADTVVKIREVIREVPAAPVVRTETVVRKDTVTMKATEPIGFPTIFFDNNSSRLNATHLNLLATTARQLAATPNYVVRLTGYASPSGNATYNQDLSAKRAAAVRQGLIQAGVSENKIVLVPGGIDYAPKNAAAARRVEVQALPR